MNNIRVKQINNSELTDFVNGLMSNASLNYIINQVVVSLGLPSLVSGLIESGVVSGISGAYPPFTKVDFGNIPITITSDVFNQIKLDFGTGYDCYFNNNNYTLATQTIPSGSGTYTQVDN